MIENYEFAVIFRRNFDNQMYEYIPFRVVEGHLDEDEEAFIDKGGNIYYHMIEDKPGNCFGLREDISLLMQDNPTLSYKEVKKRLLKEAKKYLYFLVKDQDDNIFIITKDKETEEITKFLDQDIGIISILSNSDNDITFEFISEDQDYEEVTDEIIAPKAIAETSKEFKVDFNIKDLYDELRKKVIGQDEPIKRILTALWENYAKETQKSRNIFVNGASGVGKTEIFRTIASLINVPMVIEDANDFTVEGYVGRSVNSMITDLIDVAGGDIKKAENGILVIDEINKLAQVSSSEVVATKGVQQALLKIVEDGNYPVKTRNERCYLTLKNY